MNIILYVWKTLFTGHTGELWDSGIPWNSQPGIHRHPMTSISLKKEFRHFLGEEKMFIENKFGQP